MKFDDVQTMSSKEIAELINKNHAHVMRDCRILDEHYKNMNLSKIGLVDYIDKKGEKRPMFNLTKIQTLDLMTGYSIELRIKVNRRWEELESTNKQLPMTQEQMTLQVVHSLEATIKLQKESIQKQLPKVNYFDIVLNSQKGMPITFSLNFFSIYFMSL